MVGYRVLFMGSPVFAVPALSALMSHPKASVVAVVTQPDQPKGRGKTPAPTPVKLAAEAESIPVFTPCTKRELLRVVAHIRPDLIVVVAYGRILPAAITDQYVCVNVHGSLLPHYRGASPIHTALMANDQHTGVTLIRMNAKMDAGDILLLSETAIFHNDFFQTLHDRLSLMGGDILHSFLDNVDLHLTNAYPQGDAAVSYCQKLFPEDALLSADRSPLENWGIIRAFSPVPGAYVVESGKRIKILEARLEDNGLVPVTVKPEGKNSMSYADYQRGKGPLSFFKRPQ